MSLHWCPKTSDILKLMINDKSQGSVATHSRFGKIFNSNIITNFLLSLPVKKAF